MCDKRFIVLQTEKYFVPIKNILNLFICLQQSGFFFFLLNFKTEIIFKWKTNSGLRPDKDAALVKDRNFLTETQCVQKTKQKQLRLKLRLCVENVFLIIYITNDLV